MTAVRTPVGFMDLFRSYSRFRWDVKRMILVGALDSIGRQPLWFILPLFIEHLGYGFDVIGYVIFVFGVSATLPMMPIGYLGDRFGRKNMMMSGQAVSAMGLGMFAFIEGIPMIMVAVAVGGLGMAMTQSCYMGLVAEKVREEERKFVFSLQALLAMVAAACTVFFAGWAAPWYGAHMGGGIVAGDRFVFVIGMVALGIAMNFMVPVPEKTKESLSDDIVIRRERKKDFDSNIPWGMIIKLSLPMALLGLGAGFIVNFFQNFFSQRFGTPMEVIGILFGVTNLLWAVSYMFVPMLADRLGSVRAIFVTEIVAIMALVAIPISGDFYITAAMYTTRMVLMNSSWPIWSAYAIHMAGERYSATTMGTTQTSFNGLRSITPAIAGHIYLINWDLPFFITAAFYTAAALVMVHFFWSKDDGPGSRKRKKGRKKRQPDR